MMGRYGLQSSTMLSAAALLAWALPLDCLQVRTAPSFHSIRFNSGDQLVPSSSSLSSIEPLQPASSWRRRTSTSSSSSLTTLHLLKGLVPTIDDDIRRETTDANLSAYAIFQRELDEGASIFAAIKAVRRRRKDKAGDYENKYKILSDYRSYSNKELLDNDHFNQAPTLDDLNQEQPGKEKMFWVTAPYRLSVFLGAFWLFPAFCNVLNTLVVVTADEFDIINDQFTPGIGILYGTFVALTLDILYERQGKVQENASVEASLLSQVTQNVLNLFRDEMDIAREASQIVADQVRIIVYRSRGSEMLSIMRADPYARLLSIVDHYQRDKNAFTPHQEALIDGLRSEIPALMEARAKRLSDEASALPPTHYLVLLVLTLLSLTGFTAATLTITDAYGNPPLESRLVFAALTAVYVLFFNFCKDMNDPFDGVYQIKRSSAASYLLQIKWLIANQPYGADVMFDTRGLAPVYDGIEVAEIGKDVKKVDEPSTIGVLPEPPSVTVSEVKKEVGLQQQVAMTAIETAPSVVSITTDSTEAPPAVKIVTHKEGLHTMDELSSTGVLTEQPLVTVSEVKKDVKPQEQIVNTSIETAAPGVSITTDSTKASPGIKIVAPSAKDFMPERKKKSPTNDDVHSQSKTTQDEMVSQFTSLSGFSGDKPEGGGGVTVPAKMAQSQPLDRQQILMNFKKTGGFGG